MKKIFISIVCVILFLSCITAKSYHAFEKVPAPSGTVNIAVVKSSEALPQNLPVTLSASSTDVILEEAVSIIDSFSLTELEGQNIFYEEIVRDENLQDTIKISQKIRYLAVVNLVSYKKPETTFFIGAASTSTQSYQLLMRLKIFDLITGKEYAAETIAESAQTANSLILKHNRRKTVGEESALGAAMEEGIYRLVDLLFA